MKCKSHLLSEAGCLECEVVGLEVAVSLLGEEVIKQPLASNLELAHKSLACKVEALKLAVQHVGETARAAEAAAGVLRAEVNLLTTTKNALLDGFGGLCSRVKALEERFDLEDTEAKKLSGPARDFADRYGVPLLRRYWRVIAYEMAMQQAFERQAATALFPSRQSPERCRECGAAIQLCQCGAPRSS